LAIHDRLGITGTVESFGEKISSRTTIRAVTANVAVLVKLFPEDYSDDPCDRLIGATALAEGFALVSNDTRIRACKEIRIIW
jgi:PIN domain nuclease of toxin-antitoxin system